MVWFCLEESNRSSEDVLGWLIFLVGWEGGVVGGFGPLFLSSLMLVLNECVAVHSDDGLCYLVNYSFMQWIKGEKDWIRE